jgi:inhibitor of KinA
LEKRLSGKNQYAAPRILVCADTGISVEFGDGIDRDLNQKVQQLFRCLTETGHPGLLSINPTYRSLFIQYDPWRCSFEKLLLLVDKCLKKSEDANLAGSDEVVIPVCYGQDFGPDLNYVAEFHGLTPQEIIRLHAAPLYDVYMIGFTPGFPYLGGLDERLVTPRLKDPRRRVPVGSVAIADRQTGIYPIESPGGWQLIGKTPLKLFDLRQAEPFFLKPGDRVRFKPITRDEFERLENH